jgi:hypothetical protein
VDKRHSLHSIYRCHLTNSSIERKTGSNPTLMILCSMP